MTQRWSIGILTTLLLAVCLLAPSCGPAPQQPSSVRVAVIGGMTMTGLWQEIGRMYEEETGEPVEVVITGPRPGLAEAMGSGRVDLLTMHSGDITTDLVADGYAVNLRPWTRNDLAIVGPSSDPAGIRGLASGAEACRRIVKAGASFVDHRSIGAREVSHKLWKAAGIDPVGAWVLKDESGKNTKILEFAAANEAYVVVGRIPVLHGKLSAQGMEILVENDPAMRRPYVVMEVNPERFPQANVQGARRLADFLFSPKIQGYLATSPDNQRGGIPLFHPVR